MNTITLDGIEYNLIPVTSTPTEEKVDITKIKVGDEVTIDRELKILSGRRHTVKKIFNENGVLKMLIPTSRGSGMSVTLPMSMIIDYTPNQSKQRAKYPNGAVVELVDDEDYYSIDDYGEIVFIFYRAGNTKDEYYLANQNAFLTEEDAKKALEHKKIHNRLIKEITMINHENNWIGDWSDDMQRKYYLLQSRYGFCENQTNTGRLGQYVMCEQAINWLLSDEVSDEERKIWLGLYD